MISREEHKESWFEFVDGKPVLHPGGIEMKQITVEEVFDEAKRAGERAKADSLLASSFLNERPVEGRDVSSARAEKIAEMARLRKEIKVIEHYIDGVDKALVTKDDPWMNSLTKRISDVNQEIAEATK